MDRIILMDMLILMPNKYFILVLIIFIFYYLIDYWQLH